MEARAVWGRQRAVQARPVYLLSQVGAAATAVLCCVVALCTCCARSAPLFYSILFCSGAPLAHLLRQVGTACPAAAAVLCGVVL